jgi:hypothetical protein
MAHSRVSLIVVLLVIVALLCGPLVAAGPLPQAAAQVALQSSLIGQEGGESYAVAILGDTAYLGLGPRLAIVSVLDPALPVLAGRSAVLPDIVQGVSVSGYTVVVAAGGSGLQVIDVTDPQLPEWKGSLDTPGNALDVAVSGAIAYLADSDGGLRIVDITDPLAPLEVGSVSKALLLDDALGVAVAGNLAYVGASAGGLAIVDVTDPANPFIRGRFPGPVVSEVSVLGNTAFVVDRQGLAALSIDVSNPLSPHLVDTTFQIGEIEDLVAVGSYLYVTDGRTGVHVFDIDAATGDIVSYRATVDTPGIAHGLAASGLSAYVADGPTGLRVINVLTDPDLFVEVGFYETLGDALGIATVGDYAYVASADQGLSVLSLTPATNPAQVGSVDTVGYAQAVSVSGSHAYIADGPGGLAVADVATPGSPSVIGQVALPDDAYAWAVALQGDYAYVAGDTAGLQIVNVSNPASPALLDLSGFVQPAEPVSDVAVQGSTAYLAAGLVGVVVVDISDPTAPVELASYATTDSAWQLDLAGGLLYIADIDGGLIILDVSVPSSPVLVTEYTGTLGAVANVTVSGTHALILTDTSLHVLDIRVPANPVLRGSYPTAGIPQASAVSAGGAVLVTDLDGGLRVLNSTVLLDIFKVYLPLIVN